jgi:hypothetical protein
LARARGRLPRSLGNPFPRLRDAQSGHHKRESDCQDCERKANISEDWSGIGGSSGTPVLDDDKNKQGGRAADEHGKDDGLHRPHARRKVTLFVLGRSHGWGCSRQD